MPTRAQADSGTVGEGKAKVKEKVHEVKEQVKQQVQERAAQLTEQARHLQGGMSEKIQSNPLLFAGGALVAGFVLGGGLKATIGGPLMRLGGGLAWKLIVLPMVTATLTRALGMTGAEEDAQS